jgi:hypothetical protein
MRGFLLITSLLFISHGSIAQLTVKPSGNDQQAHFLYVKEDLLFVNRNLNLIKNPVEESESSLYLRRGAQLLQGEGQTARNSGTGSISIFAEGTTNAFDYNYWGVPVTSPQNGLFGTSLLYSPFSPVKSRSARQTTALNGSANPLIISTRWIYTFAGNSYFNWSFIGGSTAIPAGYGFTMKGTDGTDATIVEGRANNPGNSQRYDFRGRPNSGVIEIPVKTEEFILLGNPYPSALDLSLFLLENSGEGSFNTGCYGNIDRKNVTTGIAYFWDSKENGNSHYLQDYVGGYGAFSPIDPCSTGIYEPPVLSKVVSGEHDGSKGKNKNVNLLPVAQGFFVQSAGEGKVIFRNGQRAFFKKDDHAHNQETQRIHKKHMKGEDPILLPRVQLIFSVEDLYERQLSIAFWDEATDGIDAGMDAQAFEIAATDAGWLKEEDSFVIDVRPKDLSAEIPLFLQVQAPHSKVSFAKGNSENDDINNLFILDTETNEYFSITEEPLNLELQPGIYHGRFRLAFAEKIPQEELPQVFFEEESIIPKFDIVQNNYLRELEIIGNDYFPVKAVGIFDLQGKRLLYRTSFDNRRSISISTGNWANAVYIVRITDMDNRKTVKKISVYNN